MKLISYSPAEEVVTRTRCSCPPKLPDTSMNFPMQSSLNLFGAALGVATNRQAAAV